MNQANLEDQMPKTGTRTSLIWNGQLQRMMAEHQLKNTLFRCVTKRAELGLMLQLCLETGNVFSLYKY
jgi:hypothetical protein